MQMTRDVVLFERLWLGSLVLGAAVSALEPEQPSSFITPQLSILFQAMAFISNAALILLVSRKDSTVSRYMLIVSFFGGLAFSFSDFGRISGRALPWALSLVAYAMQAAGLYYLHRAKNPNRSLPPILSKANAGLLDHALNLVESGNYNGAIALFDLLLESDPGNVDAHCGRGLCYLRLGQKDKGRSDLKYAALHGSVPALELLREP